MQNERDAILRTIIAAVSLIFSCVPAAAQNCAGNDGFTLHVSHQKLVMTPVTPLSIPADSFDNGTATFFAKVVESAGYDVQPGEIRLQQVLVKTTEQGPELCGGELLFTEPEFDNSADASCIVAEVTGEPGLGNEVCFDVIVDRVGRLDPRARVTDEAPLLDLLPQIRELVNVIDELSGGERNALGPVFDEYFINFFGMTEEEARRFLEENTGME